MSVGEIISYSLAFIGLAAGGLGVTSKARQDSIVNALSKDNVATKDYNQTLEAENARLVAERDSWQREADTFRKHAQGSPQLKAVAEQTKILTTALGDYTKAVSAQTKVFSDYILKDKGGRRARKTA